MPTFALFSPISFRVACMNVFVRHYYIVITFKTRLYEDTRRNTKMEMLSTQTERSRQILDAIELLFNNDVMSRSGHANLSCDAGWAG